MKIRVRLKSIGECRISVFNSKDIELAYCFCESTGMNLTKNISFKPTRHYEEMISMDIQVKKVRFGYDLFLEKYRGQLSNLIRDDEKEQFFLPCQHLKDCGFLWDFVAKTISVVYFSPTNPNMHKEIVAKDAQTEFIYLQRDFPEGETIIGGRKIYSRMDIRFPSSKTKWKLSNLFVREQSSKEISRENGKSVLMGKFHFAGKSYMADKKEMVDTITDDATKTFYLLGEQTIFKILWGSEGSMAVEYHLKSDFDLTTISLDMYWKNELTRKVVFPGTAIKEKTAMTMKKVVVGWFSLKAVKSWEDLEIVLVAKKSEDLKEEAIVSSELWELDN